MVVEKVMPAQIIKAGQQALKIDQSQNIRDAQDPKIHVLNGHKVATFIVIGTSSAIVATAVVVTAIFFSYIAAALASAALVALVLTAIVAFRIDVSKELLGLIDRLSAKINGMYNQIVDLNGKKAPALLGNEQVILQQKQEIDRLKKELQAAMLPKEKKELIQEATKATPKPIETPQTLPEPKVEIIEEKGKLEILQNVAKEIVEDPKEIKEEQKDFIEDQKEPTKEQKQNEKEVVAKENAEGEKSFADKKQIFGTIFAKPKPVIKTVPEKTPPTEEVIVEKVQQEVQQNVAPLVLDQVIEPPAPPADDQKELGNAGLSPQKQVEADEEKLQNQIKDLQSKISVVELSLLTERKRGYEKP